MPDVPKIGKRDQGFARPVFAAYPGRCETQDHGLLPTELRSREQRPSAPPAIPDQAGLQYVLNADCLPVTWFGTHLTSLNGCPLFHSLAEGFSTIVGCGPFTIAWNVRSLHACDRPDSQVSFNVKGSADGDGVLIGIANNGSAITPSVLP